MQNQWTVQQLVQSVASLSGQCLNTQLLDQVFTSVTTDSRQVVPPALYVALKGERFDGHDFVMQAVEAGAVAVLFEQHFVSEVQKLLEADAKFYGAVAWVSVQDCRLALGAFAAWHRQQLMDVTWVGVTGSNGKTTTKTLLKTILENFAPTAATLGNLNNELGVPRTLLSVTPDQAFAVVEMGANHVGEIAYLTDLVQPQVALITSVAPAHIEGFGSLEKIVQAKGEIFQGLTVDGVAVFPAEGLGTVYWQQQCAALGHRVLTFGESNSASVQLLSFEQQSEQICFSLQINQGIWQGQQFHLCVPAVGRHNAHNVCAAFAVCLALELDLRLLPAALQNYVGEKGRLRMQTLTPSLSDNQVTVIDDSYNANPASVKAGIDTLVTLAQTVQSGFNSGQTLLCLGAMAELGAETEALHREVGLFAQEKGVSHLWAVGAALPAALAFGDQGRVFDSVEALIDALERAWQQGDLKSVSHIFVKGSRSAGMEKVVQALHRLQSPELENNKR